MVEQGNGCCIVYFHSFFAALVFKHIWILIIKIAKVDLYEQLLENAVLICLSLFNYHFRKKRLIS